MVDFMLGREVQDEILERALDVEDIQRRMPIQMRPSLIYGLMLMGKGRFAEATSALGALRDQIIQRGEESALPQLLFFLVALECWTGNLQLADGYADEVLTTADEDGGRGMRGVGLSGRLLVQAYRGEIDAA